MADIKEPKLTQRPLVDPFDFNRGATYGVGGFRRASGWIYNDYILELSDPLKLPWIWREMRETNTAVAAMVYAVESIANGVKWHVESGYSGDVNEEGMPTETDMDKAAAEFLTTNMEDLNTSWQELITDLLTSVTYGWAFDECTYKHRKGDTGDPNVLDSKYNDGRIGWGKFTPIAQVTRWAWIFNEDTESPHYNEAVAIEQFASPNWMRRHIPLNKGIHVTFKSYMGSPEGWSPLRAVYTTYRYSQRLQLIMAQGADRDLTGYPVVYIPEEVIMGYASGDPVYTEVYNKYVALATKTRRDDSEGLVLPSSVYMDMDGKPTSVPKYRFELLTSGGSRQFNLVEVLTMLNNWILTTLASDIISLGHEGVGSFALADVKDASFKKGVEAILNRIEDAINTQLVPKLFELNPEFDVKVLPTIVHDGIEEKDTSGIADYLVKLKQAGIPVPLDKDMLTYLLEQAKIPVPSEQALEHSIEMADQMAQQPQNQFQMNYDPDKMGKSVRKAAKSELLDDMDVSDEILSILNEYGIFEEEPKENKQEIQEL